MKNIAAVLALGILMSSGARAGELTSGDWTWSIDDPEMFYAGTGNSAGQMLMQLCDISEGSCMYAVGLETTCSEGAAHPALVNTDETAASITLHCGKKLKDGSNLMFIEDFDQIDGIIRDARRIGFALPMEGDEFKAVRFSLKGAVQALDAMRKVAAKSNERRPGVRDAKDTEVF